MSSVGRPVKYIDDNVRIETRRIQNRENQRRCRKRKKILEELNSFSTTINRNKEYRHNLVNFFKQFNFNYFFTGTIDLNYLEKEKLKKRNKEIQNQSQTLETWIFRQY